MGPTPACAQKSKTKTHGAQVVDGGNVGGTLAHLFLQTHKCVQKENGGGGRIILTWTHLDDCFIHAVSRKGCQSWTSLNPRRLFAWPQACGHPAYGSSMSKNSCLGGAAPRYHAQEPSLLLMQAKNLAWCPLMFFSVTQSIQRHSSGEEM